MVAFDLVVVLIDLGLGDGRTVNVVIEVADDGREGVLEVCVVHVVSSLHISYCVLEVFLGRVRVDLRGGDPRVP